MPSKKNPASGFSPQVGDVFAIQFGREKFSAAVVVICDPEVTVLFYDQFWRSQPKFEEVISVEFMLTNYQFDEEAIYSGWIKKPFPKSFKKLGNVRIESKTAEHYQSSSTPRFAMGSEEGVTHSLYLEWKSRFGDETSYTSRIPYERFGPLTSLTKDSSLNELQCKSAYIGIHADSNGFWVAKLEHCENLQKLEVSGSRVNQNLFDAICDRSDLLELSIQAHVLKVSDFSKLKQLTQLEQLTIIGVKTDKGLSSLGKMSNLRYLALTLGKNVNDLSVAANELQLLEELSLGGHSGSSGIKNLKFLRHLKSLKYITLYSIKCQEDNSLSSLNELEHLVGVHVVSPGNWDKKELAALENQGVEVVRKMDSFGQWGPKDVESQL